MRRFAFFYPKSPYHVDNLLLQLLALELEVLHRLHEQLVAVPLACALNGKDEVVPPAAKLDLALKLGVPQALPADGILHRILDDSLDFARVALVAAASHTGLLLGHLVQANDTVREAAGKLFRIGAQDGPEDLNGGEQSVRGGRDGGELGVVAADALVHVHGQVNGLLRAHLDNQDVRVDGGNGVLAGEELLLAAHWRKDNVLCIDVGVVVGLEGVVLAGGGVRVDGAGDIEVEADGVVVEAAGKLVLAVVGLLVPLEERLQALAAALERDQSQAVGEHLILDDGCVVVDEDMFNRQRGDLGDENAAKGVCQRGVDADQRK